MKRWYLTAVAGLCSAAAVAAQEGTLAPTVPMVPAPVLQNGSLVSPSGVGGSSRPFSLTRWSPLRNPATASVTEPITPSAATYGHAMPPLPPTAGGADGACGAGGCATGRQRVGWDRLKTWLCYHPSKTELPKCQPTPYVTPLLGMFPCSSGPGYGCANGNGYVAAPNVFAPPAGQPLGPPTPYTPQPMIPPMGTPGAPGTAAAPVAMPPRGTQGTLQPTWQGRVTPAPAMADPGITGYRFAAPQATANPGPVVNTSLNVPAPK